MPVYKLTMLFNMVSNPSGLSIGNRTGGWSESLYSDTAITFDHIQVNNLCINRANLLCNGAKIIGRRIQQVDVVGAANVDGRIFPGASGTPPDIPQMALLMRFTSKTTQNTRPYLVRGIPDGIVVEGEYKPGSSFPGLLDGWCFEMEDWCFKAVDLVTGLTEIATIDALGNVVLATPNLYAVNDVVTILRSTDEFGRRFGGKYKIIEVTDSSNFKVLGWWNIATKGGLVRPYAVIYPRIKKLTPAAPVRVTTRKVGRPFDQYRGRATVRR